MNRMTLSDPLGGCRPAGPLTLCMIVCVLFSIDLASAGDIPEHDAISAYEGPATCVSCHQTEAESMFGRVHYQWTGPTPNVPNIAGSAGKNDGGFNTYCGSVATSRRISCWSCHVGNGGVPSTAMTTDQLNNIDCMMCHQEKYRRKAVGSFETVSATDYKDEPRSWQLPVEDAAGNFTYGPDEENMEISVLEAARTVHLPTRASCLRCHAYAAGSDGGKRGDLSSDTANPSGNVDVHMSPGGANLSCQNCHQLDNQPDRHRVMGRGLDLRPNDTAERLTCLTGGCHTDKPHGDDEEDDAEQINAHTGRVACQTCHIPRYAKGISTEMERNWDEPVWAAGLFGGQGGYKPEEIRGSDLIPTYAWYDGTSKVYKLGQAVESNGSGQYSLGVPLGTVRSAASHIYPMKEHLSKSARHDATGQMIPHSTFTYFVTGDFSRAVNDGMAAGGLSGTWSMVDVHTFQTINHGVEPHDNALECGQCHSFFTEDKPLRMNLKGELGYTLKNSLSNVCVQCHEYETPKDFKENHGKHVKDKRRDCFWCHGFTRPERGLALPVGNALKGDIDGNLAVDLVDTVIALQTMAGLTPDVPVRPAYDLSDADVDGNDKVGVGEAIYTLQSTAALR